MEERHIGISLGNIGALHDGLGEFSWQIGQRLVARAPTWRQRHGIVLHVHCRDKLGHLFGEGVDYLGVTRWQRLHHAQPQRYALWHSLHQLNKTLPPAGTGVRLVTVHDLNYLYGRSAFSTWRHHRRTKALVARSDALAAISHHTAADVRRHLGWAGDITVIHNGARSFVGTPQEPLPGWALQPGRPFLFHLSRMSPSKNPQAILDLAAAWPEMTFVMAGPPSDDAKALRAANRLPNVQFHLGISDAQKAWAYGACAGFLFPSLTEGFGLPPIEAMHFGKPVFLSALTCLPEIGGAAADYFEGPQAFAPTSMRSVIEQGLARHASDAGRADAVRAHAAHFDWDRAADAYAALYLRLLGLPGRMALDNPRPMRIHRRFSLGPAGTAPGGCALTIGNFDGVHRGHQAMLALLVNEARHRGVPSCVLTFEPHPRDFFAARAGRPDTAPARIATLRDKLAELRRCGVDHVVVARFDERLASMPAQAFIDDVLRRGLRARYVLVGDDFSFGARRQGNYAMLDAAGAAAGTEGFDVARMMSYEVHGLRVSSSAVREALAAGNMAAAEALLGRPYAISGRVQHGRKLGRELGFRTLNLRFGHARPAAMGIFVVSVHGLAATPLAGVASLGVRPTVEDAGRVLLETHCLDWPASLGTDGGYGRAVRVDLLHKLHDELKYESLEALREGIARDTEAARAWHAAQGTASARPAP